MRSKYGILGDFPRACIFAQSEKTTNQKTNQPIHLLAYVHTNYLLTTNQPTNEWKKQPTNPHTYIRTYYQLPTHSQPTNQPKE